MTDLGKAYISESCSNSTVSAEWKLARNITTEAYGNETMKSAYTGKGTCLQMLCTSAHTHTYTHTHIRVHTYTYTRIHTLTDRHEHTDIHTRTISSSYLFNILNHNIWPSVSEVVPLNVVLQLHPSILVSSLQCDHILLYIVQAVRVK